MTISGDTVCSVIQAFPVLLILAQNSNRCIKTPLIYHPPTSTHSPEYYEALDALVHSLYGHGHDDHGGHHDHNHDDHDHGCQDNHGYQYQYSYGKKSDYKYYYNQKPCPQKPHYGHTGHGQTYGHNNHGYGHTGITYVLKGNKNHGQSGHGQTYGHNNHGYGHTGITYVLKGNKNHGQSGHGHDGTKVYAPNQIYNIKHKSKVMVRKNKRGHQKSAAITVRVMQGFFPHRDNRGFSQSLVSPTRIRDRLQGILHLQPQNADHNPAYVYPFNNRPTDEYGRPIYEYRPYDYGRPNHNSRPGLSNNNMNQNQFGVPNRNDFYEQNRPQNGFQNPNQNGFQYPPSQVGFPSAPTQTEAPNNGNGFQNPPSQNGFQEQPSPNVFQEQPSQNGFQEQPSQNGFQDKPSQNGFQEQPSQNGFQEQPSQNGFQNKPSQNGIQDKPSLNGFEEQPSQNGFQDKPSQNGFQEQPSQNGFQDKPSQNEFQKQPSQNGFQKQPSHNGFQEQPSQIGFQEQPGQNGFQKQPSHNGFQEQPSQIGFQEQPGQNGFQNAPTQVGFPSSENESPNSDGNNFQEAPNRDGNIGAEEKPNENTLIVIPGNTNINEGGLVFGGPTNAVVFPDSQDESKAGFTKAPEETPKAESTTVLPATPALPPLTPVSTDSRNNFNFGPSGIFQETCTTVENEVGSCLVVTECQPYLKLIQESRSNPNALRVLRQAHCGFQGSNPKVCCPRPGIPTGPPPTLPPTTTTTEATILMPVEPEPSAEPKELEPQLGPVSLPEAPVCGVSNASFSRVVGGIPAKLGDFPWMALLGYKERRAGAGARWLCGGSLISARHVLTAAHCIHTRENDLYLVRLGELDLARDDDGATPVDVLIKSLVKHEEYSPKSFTNDIGILVLTRNVQFTDLIQPICVPRSGELRSRSYENYTPLIAGWGDTEFRGPSATHLQVLQLPVVSNEFCAQAYTDYKAQVIDQRVLCAGFKKGGKDACQGDSGGPLMQPIYNTETHTTFFYQIGVVSYGKKCAEAGFPGVYTRVTNFVPWIEDTVANN